MKAKKSFPYELIGKEINIIDSANKCNLGISGKVVDETKFTLKIRHAGKIKTLLKRDITFRLDNKIIDGKDLIKRPEERIKN